MQLLSAIQFLRCLDQGRRQVPAVFWEQESEISETLTTLEGITMAAKKKAAKKATRKVAKRGAAKKAVAKNPARKTAKRKVKRKAKK
jgi:hypothetical protein